MHGEYSVYCNGARANACWSDASVIPLRLIKLASADVIDVSKLSGVYQVFEVI